jgi:hypothetical protein
MLAGNIILLLDFRVVEERTGKICENRWLSFKDKHREGFKGWLVKVA